MTTTEPTVAAVPCPCCGEDDWCPQELAALGAEVEAAPELVIGVATYGGRWPR